MLRPLASRRHAAPRLRGLLALAVLSVALHTGRAPAGTPSWMQEVANATLPTHDAETAAVLLYAETVVTIESAGRLHRLERRVYRILRPQGAVFGTVRATVSPVARVTGMRGWCIPASGKGYEVRNSDAVEAGVPGAESVYDQRVRVLQIPASVAGSVIGSEVETEQQAYPFLMSSAWRFQETVPVREARFTLELPAGWQYQATWLNHGEIAPEASTNRWQWKVSDVKAIRLEADMPPWWGIAGQMWISLIPPEPQRAGPRSWREMGTWYLNLTQGRRDMSPAIASKVAELTASSSTVVGKMRALAGYVQSDIRYVAIELGTGGYQPHPAADVFTNRYGDCKDKVTLLSAMLREIGVESTYVLVDTNRGAVTAATPANPGFNHAILAIRLPAGAQDPTLLAVRTEPGLGPVLFFDPTDPYTPFGSLPGLLQGGYGLLVAPDGGELVQLPQLLAVSSGVQRTAQMTLDETGTLRGEVHEVLSGTPATRQRAELVSAGPNPNYAGAVESHIGSAFTSFQIQKATVLNLRANDRPLEWNYSLEAGQYAKASGDLLVVRPRVLGSETSALLETREARESPVEFASAAHGADVFEITLPPGYQVDDLPPPVDADYEFASYHSKTEVVGGKLRYSRTFEVRELSVPAAKASELRALYRAIYADERANAVLKRTPH